MKNERQPVAKMRPDGATEYRCRACGGLCEPHYSFLGFIDHLIRDLSVRTHPLLQQPRLVGDDDIWYQIPGSTKLLPGLPGYDPHVPEWKELLAPKQKIHPQAQVFLPDIGDWLAMALSTLNDLSELKSSNVTTAELLVSIVATTADNFKEQKEYLLRHSAHLEQTGTDPKWLAKPGNQARFVAHSMAGARWGLTTSTSREMIRRTTAAERKEALTQLNITARTARANWWLPDELQTEN
jgi:hypothetical protein